eukprot:m.185790 g.185790  ORF g.185790 m.185790 type:complete len:75 (-) comp13606_c0_seq8:2143-2367(-)
MLSLGSQLFESISDFVPFSLCVLKKRQTKEIQLKMNSVLLEVVFLLEEEEDVDNTQHKQNKKKEIRRKAVFQLV